MPLHSDRPRVLVTGATGFLGAHVVRSFLERGWAVAAARRAASDPWRLARLVDAHANLFDAVLDLLEPHSIADALNQSRPQVIVHCAAYGVDHRQQDAMLAIASNVTGSVKLVEAAVEAGVSRLIHIGSCYEYGDHPHPVGEEAALRPQSTYGASKAAATLMTLARANLLELPLVVLRPFGIYGPLEGGHKFVPMVMRACLRNEALALTPGEQVRDYVYVGDVASCCADLAHGDIFPAGEVFNLGSGQGMTLRAFGESIAEVAGQGTSMLQWGKRPYRRDEIMHLVAKTAKTRRLLGWKPATSLRHGLSLVLHEMQQKEIAAA